jgi:hypothetical protein
MSVNTLKIAYGSPKLPLKIGGLALPCYILRNNQHVLPIAGIQKLLGYEGKSETWLLNILISISKFEKIPKELLQAYEQPFKIDINPTKTNVEILNAIHSRAFLETCQTIVDAKNNGLLGANLIKISKPAALIIEQTKNKNIDTLIDNATGYQTYKTQVLLSFELYMQSQLEDEAVFWLKTIADDFYFVLFKIHNQDWRLMKTSPEIMGSLIYDLIFCRINTEILSELRAKAPKRAYLRKDNHPQNNENLKLKGHILNLMALLETAEHNWFIFLQLLQRTYPIQNHYDSTVRFKKPLPKEESLSSFNMYLKKLT